MKYLKFGVCLVLFVTFMVFSISSEVEAQTEKDKILIGAARPLSGPLVVYEEASFGPIYKMWVEEVNARGGIYVEEYGKKLPVEMRVYDDKSDIGTMTRLLEKLILEDKVDFVFPPASTAFLFAAGAVTNRYGYILLGAEGGATSIRDMLPGMPYFFGVLNFSDHNQIPVLADIFEEFGVKTTAIMFIEDLHGIEYSGVATREFGKKGIKIALTKSIPPDIKDVSPILKEAKALNVDAFCSFTYPDAGFLVTGQAIELGFNPKAIIFGPGGNFEIYKKIFGAEVIDGVMGEGAWNYKSSPAAKEFYDKFVARYSEEILDWWGHLPYYAGLQCFEQAIEKAGTLDQKKIRDILATEKFDTVLGSTWFDTVGGGGGLLAVDCYAGQIGQWQNGVFEVIGPKDKATAETIYPKPAWPQKK
jgi:branched-chain amino acid transport system substrate-binding protein